MYGNKGLPASVYILGHGLVAGCFCCIGMGHSGLEFLLYLPLYLFSSARFSFFIYCLSSLSISLSLTHPPLKLRHEASLHPNLDRLQGGASNF